MWTSAARIGEFLQRFQAQPVDLRHAPFHREQLEVRRTDGEASSRGLERNGPRAIEEFAKAEELWKERVRATTHARHSG